MLLDVRKVKIAVAVPLKYLTTVRDAMCDAGCGVIGKYSHCTMSTKIIGTFMGGDDSNPFVGDRNELIKNHEIKLEALCDVENVKEALAAIRRVHPYEEVGIDLYPVILEEDL